MAFDNASNITPSCFIKDCFDIFVKRVAKITAFSQKARRNFMQHLR
jgi:hypothetical protein